MKMAHKLALSTRRVDLILKNGLFTENFNIFARALPKSLEFRQFLSQSSVNLTRLPKGCVGPIAPKEGNKGATNVELKGAADQNINVKGNSASITTLQKSAPKDPNQTDPQSPLLLSTRLAAGQRPRYITLDQALGDSNSQGRDKEKSSAGPAPPKPGPRSGGNCTGKVIWVAMGALGVSLVCFTRKNNQDFNSNGAVDNSLGRATVKNTGTKIIVNREDDASLGEGIPFLIISIIYSSMIYPTESPLVKLSLALCLCFVWATYDALKRRVSHHSPQGSEGQRKRA